MPLLEALSCPETVKQVEAPSGLTVMSGESFSEHQAPKGTPTRLTIQPCADRIGWGE
jgi:hypothetical protein